MKTSSVLRTITKIIHQATAEDVIDSIAPESRHWPVAASAAFGALGFFASGFAAGIALPPAEAERLRAALKRVFGGEQGHCPHCGTAANDSKSTSQAA